jgi:excisionase family DNA binding protein
VVQSPRTFVGEGTDDERSQDRGVESVALLTVDEAAFHLGTSPRFVRRLIAERRIAFAKLGKHVRLDSSDLDAFIAAGRVEATSTVAAPLYP